MKRIGASLCIWILLLSACHWTGEDPIFTEESAGIVFTRVETTEQTELSETLPMDPAALEGDRLPSREGQEQTGERTDSVDIRAEPDSPARAAFREALAWIYEQQRWPEPEVEEIHLWEDGGGIEEERFAIFDVDGDGEEELIVAIANTYVAGMREVIYGYDHQTGKLRIEANNHIAVTHYPGMLKADLSHNHGKAGYVLWPYYVLEYDAQEDVYREAYFVDAWCKEFGDYDSYYQVSYPEDVDTEQEGYVYLITENGQTVFLNRRDFALWEEELFADLEPLDIPWQNITPENFG